MADVGALKVLAQHGILGQIEAVACTSAGAITAALVAFGYTADELGQTMLAMDLQQEAVLRVQNDYVARNLDDQRRTVNIDDRGGRATDFGLSPQLKQQLIDNGPAAMIAYLDAPAA